jgi:hypothetical protein
MEEWQRKFEEHLRAGARSDHTAESMALLITEALIIAEAEKYATSKSRFSFTIADCDEAEAAHILALLPSWARGIVEIELKF